MCPLFCTNSFAAHPGHRAVRLLGQIWQVFDPKGGFPEDVPARNHVPCESTNTCHVMVALCNMIPRFPSFLACLGWPSIGELRYDSSEYGVCVF